jgi:glycosyltransferase involved in cell wall biosynthesis
VIVAAWQAAATIGAALRSVFAQTESAIEVVVCDDGSTDDLRAAIAPFGDALRLLRVPHGGPSIARNTAAAATSGDFVVILDADDTWEPRRLERIADLAAQRPDLDLITTDAWFLVDGVRRGTFYQANDFPVADQAVAILRGNFFFGHVAVRRSRWTAHGGCSPQLTRGEDWDLWLRMLLSGSVAGCVLEPLATYRVHESSLSADRYRSLMARVEVLDRAEAQHRLTSEQRAVLDEARAAYRRRAVAAHAEFLLMTRGAGRRRANLALLRTAGTSKRVKARSAAATVAPGWVGRRLARRALDRGRTVSDRSFPASGAAGSTPNRGDQ